MRLESTSLVILGHWNVAVLSPDWIARHILQGGNKDVNVLVKFPAGASFSPIFIIEGISYKINPQRVELIPSSWVDPSLSSVETVASQIARQLPHTPVSAVGLNFHFNVDDYDPEYLRRFDIENGLLDFIDAQTTLTQTEIKKSISLEQSTLNLSQILTSENRLTVRFNYHYQVSSTTMITEILAGQSFLAQKSITLRMLQRMFGTDPEEITEAVD